MDTKRKEQPQRWILSKLQSLYFQWEIVSTTYTMDPTEKIIFNSIVIVLLLFLAYSFLSFASALIPPATQYLTT